MRNIIHDPIMCKKFPYVEFLIAFIFLLAGLLASTASTTYASSDPHNSGYDHGCDDSRISDPSDRYVNQPEKGPSFHTAAFMQGYYNGFDGCSHTNTAESITSPETGSFKIDATIDLDREAILHANGNNLGDAWFTINGQRYGK
jgi:hypothetical protein